MLLKVGRRVAARLAAEVRRLRFNRRCLSERNRQIRRMKKVRPWDPVNARTGKPVFTGRPEQSGTAL